ncbi:hypothetical protein R3P38DRAFT_2774406 [Favolaschia claudopus]|uniref:Uncharacterized protein n=1 Tax=Favolaschia claudopus TaxID=2862362 RepID=A0AAW0C0Z7_9AGAR
MEGEDKTENPFDFQMKKSPRVVVDGKSHWLSIPEENITLREFREKLIFFGGLKLELCTEQYSRMSTWQKVSTPKCNGAKTGKLRARRKAETIARAEAEVKSRMKEAKSEAVAGTGTSE